MAIRSARDKELRPFDKLRTLPFDKRSGLYPSTSAQDFTLRQALRMWFESNRGSAMAKVHSRESGNRSKAMASGTAVAKRSKLAAWGDPYVTEDGRVVPPEVLFEDVAKSHVKSSSDYKPLRRRSIPELPASAKSIKGIALVFTLTILGLTDRDIGEMLEITPSDVRRVRQHPGYSETFEIVASEFVSAKSKRLISRIAAYADDALDQVHNIAMHGQKESNVLRANIDLLDRAGVRPKDMAENKGQTNELKITIIKSDSEAEVAVNGMTIDGV